MKKFKFASLCLAMLVCGICAGCSSEEEGGNEGPVETTWEDDDIASLPVLFGNEKGNQEVEVTRNVTIAKGTYLLKGWCYITDGTTVTIEPGTVIRGDKDTKAALIVERGGKLIAKGTQNEPIVMTSEMKKGYRKPGDWGGLIVCGKARTNQGEQQIEGGPRTKHGGSDDNDSSGELQYLRVEFAGYPFKPDQEINGITFGSVGKGTTVDHLQVSYSNDDSYEWFGGVVDCKYLIAYHSWDDDFDTDNGFSGNVQYCLSIRNPRLADQSQSNGFESDNDADGDTKEPRTKAKFSNVTFIGPIGQDAAFENTTTYINGGDDYPNNGSGLGLFQAAMQIRRNSNLSCYNSLAVGYPIGLLLDNEKGDTQGNATAGSLELKNLWFANMGILGSDANKLYRDKLVTGYDSNKKPIVDENQESFSSSFFKKEGNKNAIKTLDELKLTKASVAGITANYLPAADSPLLGAGDPALPGSSSYIGAFNGPQDNWIEGWTNFDPQNTDY